MKRDREICKYIYREKWTRNDSRSGFRKHDNESFFGGQLRVPLAMKLITEAVVKRD
jgi:hypothetical protein